MHFPKKPINHVARPFSHWNDEGIAITILHSFGGMMIETDTSADSRFDYGKRVTSFLGTEPANFTDIWDFERDGVG